MGCPTVGILACLVLPSEIFGLKIFENQQKIVERVQELRKRKIGDSELMKRIEYAFH